MQRNLRFWLLSLLGIIVILLILLLIPTLSQARQPLNRGEISRSLSVTGEGFVDIPQTLAQVQLGIEIQKDTAIATQTAIAENSNSVVDVLQKQSEVKKLSTTGIRLNPVYQSQNGQSEVTAYQGSNIVRFQIDPGKIGSLLDEAIAAGASRIDGVTLVASDEAIAKATDEAIALATEQAQHQAKSALNALKLKQQEVLHIQINGANSPSWSAAQNLTNSIPVATTPIIAAEQRISAAVTLQLRY